MIEGIFPGRVKGNSGLKAHIRDKISKFSANGEGNSVEAGIPLPAAATTHLRVAALQHNQCAVGTPVPEIGTAPGWLARSSASVHSIGAGIAISAISSTRST